MNFDLKDHIHVVLNCHNLLFEYANKLSKAKAVMWIQLFVLAISTSIRSTNMTINYTSLKPFSIQNIKMMQVLQYFDVSTIIWYPTHNTNFHSKRNILWQIRLAKGFIYTWPKWRMSHLRTIRPHHLSDFEMPSIVAHNNAFIHLKSRGNSL